MAPNPWKFDSFQINQYWRGKTYCEVNMILLKRDIRSGYDLGIARSGVFTLIEDVDFKNKDKYYWKELFRTVLNADYEKSLKIPYHKKISVIRQLKHIRYNIRRPKQKTWEDRYGRTISTWAKEIIVEEMNDSCIDNIRLARVGDRKAVKKYRKQKEQGCCGYFDVIRRCPYDWFRKYHIGCNYGH